MKWEKETITPEIKSNINKLLETDSKYSVALDVGISESTLYKYLKGYPISVKSVDKIKEYLEVIWVKIE